MDWKETAKFLADVCSPIAVLFAAIATFHTARGVKTLEGTAEAMDQTAKSLKEATQSLQLYVKGLDEQMKSTTMLECLKQYIDVNRRKTQAISSASSEMAKSYFRELFDLFWSEFHIWRNGHIDDKVMAIWADARYRLFSSNYCLTLPPKPNHNPVDTEVFYREEWDALVNSNYFGVNSEFVAFTNLIHDNKIDNALHEFKIKTQ